MTSLLVDRIGLLVTNDPWTGAGPLGILRNAAVLADDGRIAWVGPSSEAPQADDRFDADGRCVMPGFVDSHTHLVFAGDRAGEFAARMRGEEYEAGGIAATVDATRKASDAKLAANVARLLAEARASGTTTIETKSGYGLTISDEERSLRIAAEATSETTFLGAHIIPAEYRDDPDAYTELVAGPMLDACAPHARWADVFVERGAFDADAAQTILKAAAAKGLGLRVHANQLGHGPGVKLAVEMGAASADHCTYVSARDLSALSSSETVATLLPAADFSTRSPYPDARRMLDAGVTVALASDCNPGSSYTTNLPFCIALAVREMGMTCEEAVWAATAGGARALRRSDVGWLTKGSKADLIVLDAPSYLHLAYRPGTPLIAEVIIRGQRDGRRGAE